MGGQEKGRCLIEDSWKSLVVKSPDDVCRIQKDLTCSGWDYLCNETTPYNNFTASNVTDVFCPFCVTQDVIANYSRTCHDAFDTEIDKYFDPVIIAGFSLVGISALSILVAYNVRKVDTEGEVTGKYEYQRV